MNFDYEFNELKSRIDSNSKRLESLQKQFINAKEFTGEFLDNCAKEGITKIAVQKEHESVPASINFPFGTRGNVFSFEPKENVNKRTWPPIWGVTERMGISGGCGNSDQRQMNKKGKEKLIDGVYHLIKGQWKRIE